MAAVEPRCSTLAKSHSHVDQYCIYIEHESGCVSTSFGVGEGDREIVLISE